MANKEIETVKQLKKYLSKIDDDMLILVERADWTHNELILAIEKINKQNHLIVKY